MLLDVPVYDVHSGHHEGLGMVYGCRWVDDTLRKAAASAWRGFVSTDPRTMIAWSKDDQ